VFFRTWLFQKNKAKPAPAKEAPAGKDANPCVLDKKKRHSDKKKTQQPEKEAAPSSPTRKTPRKVSVLCPSDDHQYLKPLSHFNSPLSPVSLLRDTWTP
jgi:hypothetical protein